MLASDKWIFNELPNKSGQVIVIFGDIERKIFKITEAYFSKTKNIFRHTYDYGTFTNIICWKKFPALPRGIKTKELNYLLIRR
jgi:hypothetical protein